jgi:integrase
MKTIPLVEAIPTDRKLTISELVMEYKKSTWYPKGLKTQKDYDAILSSMVHSPYAIKAPEYITTKVAEEIYKHYKETSGVRSSEYFITVMGRVWNYGVAHDWIKSNPWQFVKPERPKARQVVWTEDQVFKVIEYALSNGYTAIAVGVCLMYDTGQRPSDILSLQNRHLKKDDSGYYIDFTQAKRGAVVRPAVSPYTMLLLNKHGGTTQYDDKYLVDCVNLAQFRKGFNRVKRACELPKELQLRDLRRTALTQMGAASDDEMSAVSGHTDRNMLNTYSLKNRQKALEAQKARYATTNTRLNNGIGGTDGSHEKV